MSVIQLLSRLFNYNRQLCSEFWKACFEPELSKITGKLILNPLKFEDWLIANNPDCKPENDLIENVRIYFDNDPEKIELVKNIFS